MRQLNQLFKFKWRYLNMLQASSLSPTGQPISTLSCIDNYPNQFTQQEYINDAILALYKTFHHSIALVGPEGSMPEQALQKVITTMRSNCIVNRDFYWSTLDNLLDTNFGNTSLTKKIYVYVIDFAMAFKGSTTYLSDLNVFLRRNPQVQLLVTGGLDLATWIRNNSIARNLFTTIEITEPNDKDLAFDLCHAVSDLDNSDNIIITKEIIDYTIKLSHQYFYQLVNPGASISILDQALADIRVFNTSTKKVTKDILNQAVEQLLGTTVESIASPLDTIITNIKQNIFGQDKAIQQIAQGLFAGRLGIRNPNRPLYSCLSFGSTGVGKTLLAKTISDTLFGKESNLFTLDMSEYADERLGPARLLGSPVGFQDHELGGLLTTTVAKSPQTVILLDEFEKAATTVKQIFLQILDQGYLLDNKNNRVDFTHTIIIATSNAGQDVHQVGFKHKQQPTKTELIDKLHNDFSSELLNRFDDIIEFNKLTKSDLEKIFDHAFSQFTKRINSRGLKIKLSTSKKQALRKQVVNSSSNGRQVQIATNQQLEKLLQKQMSMQHELA